MARRRLTLRRSPREDSESGSEGAEGNGGGPSLFDREQLDQLGAKEAGSADRAPPPASAEVSPQTGSDWGPVLKDALARTAHAYDRVQKSLDAYPGAANLVSSRIEVSLARAVRRVESVLDDWSEAIDEARARREERERSGGSRRADSNR